GELENLEANGNSIEKIQHNGNWNGGAASINRVSDNGYFEFVTAETNRRRAVGLSAANLNSNFNTIDYAFFLESNANLRIYENGNNRGNFGSYSTGDTLRIAVENGTVHYYQNGELLRIASTTPSLPLLVDVSIRDIGGTVEEAVIANLGEGSFSAFAKNAGPSAIYQWFLNGNPVGTNSSTFASAEIGGGDLITCQFTSGAASCNGINYVSNPIQSVAIEHPESSNFFIAGTLAPSACQKVSEEVVWDRSELENVDAHSNSLIKIQSNGNWNGGAASLNRIGDNGYFTFIVSETNKRRMAGLSDSNVSSNFTNIDYAFYLESNTNLRIYENGNNRGYFGTYSTGDTLKISVENGIIHYYRNQELLRIASTTPSLPLLVDVSIRDVDGTVTNAKVTNYNAGSFTAFAENAGPNPTYQWLLNGTPVGTNSATYSNENFTAGDVVTCQLNPDADGCNFINYLSNTIEAELVKDPAAINFHISGDVAASACQQVLEEVMWNIDELENVDANANNLIKVQNNGNWNGGAISLNTVNANGYFEFIATETNRRRMVGLSDSNINSNFTTIDYAFYLEANSNLRIYESGNNRGSYGTFSTGDTLRISVKNGSIHYYHNRELLRIASGTPALPLFADVSIRDIDGTVSDAVIANYNGGDFTAYTENAGADPTYQWFLNGAMVGTNSNTYSNPNIEQGDVVFCQFSPDLGGCSEAIYTSNVAKILEQVIVEPADLFISTAQSISGYAYAEEDIEWEISALINVQATDNSIVKVQSNNNWDGGAASRNRVFEGGYFEFGTAENNERKMVGLSTTNTSSNQTSIDYAFYLESNGNVRIFESGSQRGFYGSYVAGDLFRISFENSMIRYFRNGVLLREISANATSLIADVSIRDINGTVTDAIIGNLTEGEFTATISGGGPAPSIQWQLNGSNVGLGSSSYSNSNLVDGDIITCLINPDLEGCNNTAFESNQIRIVGPTAYTTWTGEVNSNWSTEGNWTMGTPNQFISAIIPSTASNQPTINALSEVNNLEIQVGASLGLGSNSLLVSGNFTANGEFDAESGTIVFRGLGESEVSGTPAVTFNRLVLNKTNLGEGLTLNTPIQIEDETVFIQGNIRATTHEIVYKNDADTRSGLNVSHVEGFVRKIGNDAFTFPVGTNGIYAPISISSPDNVTDEFVASYYDTSAEEAGYDTAERDPSLVTLSTCEYWVLDREVGNSPVAVSLAYEYERSCGTSEPADLRIARWDGTMWQNHGYSGHQGDSLSGVVRSAEEITAFSPFTFASGSFNNPLPIELIFFDANASGKAVKLDWTTVTELNNDYFTIERSSDGVHFERVGFVNGNGNSSEEISYSFVDDAPFGGTSYYRLKQTDFDGQFETYPMVPVTIEESLDLLVYPNPAIEKVTVQAVGRGEKLIRLINFSGVEIASKRTSDQTLQFDLAEFSSGIYIVEVSNGSTVEFKKLIVQ
ncbi:MAG: T9SS type A sorting domain-containing protein, partial [Cryomorphaceae bacterium]